jgi:hypothetical protein
VISLTPPPSNQALATAKEISPMPASIRTLALGLAIGLIALAGLAAPAVRADFGIAPGSYSSLLSETAAGAHPDYTTSFVLNSHPAPAPFNLSPDDNLRSVIAKLPPGLVGNPEAYPKCSAEFFATHEFCPANTQIGIVHYTLSAFPLAYSPLYNMVAQSDHIAEIGFENVRLGAVQIHIIPSLRSSEDYGITATLPSLNTNLNLLDSSVTIWGVPADPSHDGERGFIFDSGGCVSPNGLRPGCERPSTVPRRPYLSAPTQCTAPIRTDISIDSWQNRRDYLTYEGEEQQLEGCNQLEFEPSITSQPTTNLADSPTGLDFNLHIPQNEDPDGRATAHLKNAVVKLPQGLTINPSSANGLGACSPSEIGLKTPVGDPEAHFTAQPQSCPNASKIGTVQVETPVLDHPVPGEVFLASQNQNPFGSLLAIYLAIEDDKTELVAKIPAKIEADPVTGQLTTTVTDNPQLPFEDLHLSFFKGAAAPLKTAIACGAFTTNTTMTPWSSPEGADAFPSDSFQITAGAGGGACVPNEASAPNNPSFSAGTIDPVANAYSPFVLRLARQDGTQRLTGIETTLPPGLLAKLAGTTYCPEGALAAAAGKSGKAEQSSPSCPASSRVGSVNVAAGAGPTPYNAQGQAYLAGPYKGAPLSLAVITPAVAGPFDLGTVVVRNALHVDPESARVKATSDPFPHILQGIPLDLRSVTVNLDRSQFTKNPTSCNPFLITGAALALTGQSAPLSNHFQVGDCKKLGFKPKLQIKLKGGTKRGEHPALTATLKARPGDANIAKAVVSLPHSEFLAQSHIRTICTRVQFQADNCPKGSVYGTATATTPLLDEPLKGNVYLRSSSNKLPDLVIALKGKIDVDLIGRIDSVKGGIRTTFASVPDAPVSKFTLRMQGGRKSLLENSRNLCAAQNRATVQIDAQSGKVYDTRPVVRARGCKGQGRKGGGGKSGGRKG